MTGHEIAIAYLKVTLSPQVVLGAVAATFLILFRVPLSSLINRMASFRWGPAELSAPQPATDQAREKEDFKLSDNVDQESESEIPDELNVSDEAAERFRQAMQAERARAHLWEYRFLNYFLVINTQRVLDWLSALPDSPTFTMYDAWWQQVIPTAEQRRTVIQVLEEHNLVVMKGDLIELTPKGKEYIQWRGPLPGNKASGGG